MTFKKKLTVLVILPVLICTTIAVIISSIKIKNQGIEGLEEKSLAILALNIQEYLAHHEDYTSVVELQNTDDTSKVDRSISQSYNFRISSFKPENLKHLSTAKENQFIEKFEREKLNQLTYIDKETDTLWVMRPVFMDKTKGCLDCHVLKDSDPDRNQENALRGIFIVKSTMKNANAQVKSAISQLGLAGFIIMVVAIFIVSFVIANMISVVVQITSSLKRLAAGEITDDLKIDINTGDEIEEMSKALNISVEGLNKKSVSATQIGQGNFSTEIHMLSDKDMLGKSLIEMRDSLKNAHEEDEKRKLEDQKRNWTTEGFAKFADILRQNSDDLQQLSDEVIRNVVKYLGANQGGIFLWIEEDKGDAHFELMSAYAWDRKKYVTKRIEKGEGLVGACAMEKETIFLKTVPKDYVDITSGLGGSNPRCVILVPLKSENQVLGVIEMASFNPIEKYQIEFLEKVGENIASTISSVRVNAKTKFLLEQSQQQSEEMAAQEEEMRQNMEELQATQEEAARRTGEVEGLISSLSASAFLVEYDLNGTIINVNDPYLNRLGMNRSQIIGKHHSDHVEMTEEQSNEYNRFWSDLRAGRSQKMKAVINWDGRISNFIENYLPVFDGDGQVVKIMKLAYELDDFR